MSDLFDSRIGYTGLVALVAIERVAELLISRRHFRSLRARGGIEAGAGHYPFMVAVHAGVLVACPLEVFLLARPFVVALALPMLALLAGTFALRYWVMATLGERWCTRVVCLPGAPLVARGPYRFLRHPNYLAVALELPALALVHSAWISALVFSALDAWVLRRRIRVEDAALRRYRPPQPGKSG